jgi:AraC-like DNA-binding protein
MSTVENFLANIQPIDCCPELMFLVHKHNQENYPLHLYHKPEVLYVRSGIAYLITPTKTLFTRSSLRTHPAPLPHRVLFDSTQRVLTVLHFAQARDAEACAPNHDFYDTLGIYPVTRLLDEMLRYTERWNGYIQPSQCEPYLFRLNLKLILLHLSHQPLPLALPTTENPRLVPVLRYIYEHMGELLELVALAQHFGFSPRSLARLFQSCLRMSFGQYLKLRRILAAMEQLLQTRQPNWSGSL